MHRPELAFIGPWNFHSGAGEACRGNLKALWRLQALYAIHPLGLARYGPHRLFTTITPSIDSCFTPDIAIVHLNPDTAPSLLSGEQKQMLRRSRHRIGYWLWENLQVPHGWSKALSWIDSMWVPSDYCKELFSGLTSIPIHIIPHVIEVDEISFQRTMPSAKTPGTILYVFDGASYLKRKNPAALLRAFHGSGLARQGWRLRLKTKNFDPAGYDHQSYQEFERSLQQLRESHPDSVELIVKDLDDMELKALIRSADIYASPHASEGFGLTIAEAMAAGVLVVATDYGGSRDLLDHTTGFPVRYRLVAEDMGHGSYQAGCVWAQIDERHFAECLCQAAMQCRQDIGSILRENAQQKVIQRCRVDYVAERMAVALNMICER